MSEGSQLLDAYLIDNEDILARTRSLRTARRVWMRCAAVKTPGCLSKVLLALQNDGYAAPTGHLPPPHSFTLLNNGPMGSRNVVCDTLGAYLSNRLIETEDFELLVYRPIYRRASPVASARGPEE